MSGELNMIQTLRKFRGGQSRDIFRGGPVKKITLYKASDLRTYFLTGLFSLGGMTGLTGGVTRLTGGVTLLARGLSLYRAVFYLFLPLK